MSAPKINSKLNDYDKNSEFFVYVVSDQIGGVKNAGGAAYITNPTDNNRYPFANLCQNAASAIQECAANDCRTNNLMNPSTSNAECAKSDQMNDQ